MRRQVSICIFYGVVLVMILTGVLFMDAGIQSQHTDSQVVEEKEKTMPVPESEQTTPVLPSSREVRAVYKYMLRAKEGEVCVYDAVTEEVYLDTGIPVQTLPETVQLQLREGMGIKTEEELFGFLESYSS